MKALYFLQYKWTGNEQNNIKTLNCVFSANLHEHFCCDEGDFSVILSCSIFVCLST